MQMFALFNSCNKFAVKEISFWDDFLNMCYVTVLDYVNLYDDGCRCLNKLFMSSVSNLVIN